MCVYAYVHVKSRQDYLIISHFAPLPLIFAKSIKASVNPATEKGWKERGHQESSASKGACLQA